MNKLIIYIAALLIINSTSCKKTDGIDAELAKLPPITQTGANTFGCLVNGKAVTPNSSCLGCPPPLEGGYDPSSNGQFGLRFRYENGKKSIGFGLDSIFTYKNFFIKDTIYKKVRVSIYNELLGNSCEWVGSLDPFQLISGSITLSRVDLPNGIFSGTFEYTIKTKNCGNYEVTNGRFDYKF